MRDLLLLSGFGWGDGLVVMSVSIFMLLSCVYLWFCVFQFR